jgi:hypothetical protein
MQDLIRILLLRELAGGRPYYRPPIFPPYRPGPGPGPGPRPPFGPPHRGYNGLY